MGDLFIEVSGEQPALALAPPDLSYDFYWVSMQVLKHPPGSMSAHLGHARSNGVVW